MFFFCLRGGVSFVVFLFGGSKGQARWPKEPPHLALNPPHFFWFVLFCFFLFLFLFGFFRQKNLFSPLQRAFWCIFSLPLLLPSFLHSPFSLFLFSLIYIYIYISLSLYLSISLSIYIYIYIYIIYIYIYIYILFSSFFLSFFLVFFRSFFFAFLFFVFLSCLVSLDLLHEKQQHENVKLECCSSILLFVLLSCLVLSFKSCFSYFVFLS